jgi:hypothetical protein
MKGQMSILIKGIYLIIVLITIAVVLNQFTSLNLARAKANKELEMRNRANDILELLTTSSNCLAYVENGTAEGRDIKLETQRIIDYDKLLSFTSTYTEIEPECARDYNYRYRVKVEKLNFTRLVGFMPGELLPPGDRDVVIIFDSSASMKNQKISIAKSAANKFLECADPSDRVALVSFSQTCDAEQRTDLLFLTPENKNTLIKTISTMTAESGTPLISSMKKAVEILDQSGPERKKMIVLMTDGRESCCEECTLKDCDECDRTTCSCLGYTPCVDVCKNKLCQFVESSISKGIPVYTVGFMVTQDAENELKCVAQKTQGAYYYASMEKLAKIFCEIAGGKVETEEPETWYFGTPTFSPDKAFFSSVQLSLPASIKMSDVKLQPAIVTIDLYSGELETLSGIIDKVCSTKQDTHSSITVSYPTFLKSDGNKNYICMNYFDEEKCLAIKCEKVEFPALAPGNYLLSVKFADNSVVVEV